ncbi:MAG: transketolase C-terminal domain-containing protein [Verrucomicrobiota bacterium]|jgi:transketolase
MNRSITTNTHNPRIAYGEALLELAAQNPNVVALDADLCKSTMSALVEGKYPERFFEMGIAEQNMAATAAGLALGGKIPFIHSFAVFVSGRAYDQIRQAICTTRLNVKIVGSSAGLSDFGDGATHQSVEDVALMRALPGMTVLSPCDALEVKKAVWAMAEFEGPVYLRLSRNDVPLLTRAETPFEIGKIQPMRAGADLAIFATGTMVATALEAARQLEKFDVSAKVVNVATLKPLDEPGVRRESDGMQGVITVEEHSVIGGLGTAVLETLGASRIPVQRVGIQDQFGMSATNHLELLEYYGLTPGGVVAAARSLMPNTVAS